jgi:hypothetical protein
LEGRDVNRWQIMVMRAVLGLVFAVLISRFFLGRFDPLAIAGLTVFLAGMSYVSEYFRNRRQHKP